MLTNNKRVLVQYRGNEFCGFFNYYKDFIKVIIMKSKSVILTLLFSILGICLIQSPAEARSSFSIGINSACISPPPRAYVAERYYPYYAEPVYVQAMPYPGHPPVYGHPSVYGHPPAYVVPPRPYYREVVRVYERPAVCQQGFSFSWGFR